MAIRRIYCEACGKNARLDPEDRANHWQARIYLITAQKPADHHITVTEHKTHDDFFKGKGGKSTRTDLSSLFCDQCGQPIPDGAIAIAYTAWRTAVEPGPWETDYSAKPPTQPPP